MWNKKKTYIVNGFLESGKTEFIKYTLSQPYFKKRSKILVILCEDGETTIEKEFLKENRVILEVIDNQEDFTVEKLKELDKKHNFKRIMIEYNGMWDHKNIELPESWVLEQQISILDTSTFQMYFNNMKSIIGDMVRNSELVIFNRANQSNELSVIKRNIKILNPTTDIVFEANGAEIPVMLEEELPYDIDAPNLTITEETYGAWFLDTLDNTKRYIGKEVKFIAKVLKKEDLPNDYFVPIRVMMTCCEDDLSSFGFVCQYENAKTLNENTWVELTAIMDEGVWPNCGELGPILHAITVQEVEIPENEIIIFN